MAIARVGLSTRVRSLEQSLPFFFFWLTYMSEKQVFSLCFILEPTGSLMAQLTFHRNASNTGEAILFEFSRPIVPLESPVPAS